MTDDDVDRQFERITRPSEALHLRVVAWTVTLGIVFAVVLGCIALWRAVWG